MYKTKIQNLYRYITECPSLINVLWIEILSSQLLLFENTNLLQNLTQYSVWNLGVKLTNWHTMYKLNAA